MKNKKGLPAEALAKAGSGLIFAVVLLFVILGMVITLSSITVLETKMSQKNKFSVGAFYNSESGVEWALNQIATKPGSAYISSIGTVDGNAVKCPVAFGADVCKILFLGEDGKVLATSATIDQVKAVRAVGTQGGDTQRTIEAAVAASPNTIQGSDGLTYGIVRGEDGKYWLDRNLGATQVATSSTDSASYGHYYQWGRGVDGHQIPTSGTTGTNSPSDMPGHANFITESANPYDWRVPQNNSLWQGVSGVNNPCPAEFRLPTQAEWNALVSTSHITNVATAFSSTSLKIPAAGLRSDNNAALYGQGNGGYYLSSTIGTGANFYSVGAPYFYASGVNPGNWGERAAGESVRCIKN